MLKFWAVLLALGLAAQANAAPARRGDPAPAINAKDTAGKPLKLADLKGKQNVLLVFWSADTCSTSDDLKTIGKLQAKYKGKPLTILGVSVDGTKASGLAKWLKSQKVGFRNLVDEKLTIADDYGIIITPAFLLVDQKGVVQSRYVGGGPPVLDALAMDAEELLKEGKVTAREEPAPSLPSG
jgi:peroxiredoxin